MQQPCYALCGHLAVMQQQQQGPLSAAPAILAPQLQQRQHEPDGISYQRSVPAVKKSSRRSGKRLNVYKKNCLAISQMQEELAQKLSLAAALEAEQSRLQAEHQLLVECCDGLGLLRLKGSFAGDAVDDSATAGYAAEELALLQQLQSIPYPVSAASGQIARNDSISISSQNNSGSSSSSVSNLPEDKQMQQSQVADGGSLLAAGVPGAAAAAAAAPGAAAGVPDDSTHMRFSPPDDIMFLYRHLLSLPPYPGAESCTVKDAVADYANMVQQIALQLHLLGRPKAVAHGGNEQPLRKIKDLFVRHLHKLTTLLLLQRTEVIEGLVLTNFETGEFSEAHSTTKHTWVLQQLQLSQQQQQDIARTMDCFARLLAPTLKERQQLQGEIAQQKEDHGSGSSGSDGHKQWMAKREAMLTRLSSILRKEYMIQMTACAAVAGSLTCVQMATTAVLMTPHAFSLQMMGMLLLQQQQHQQKQQQPQG